MLRVKLGGPLMSQGSGTAELEIEASTIRDLLAKLGIAHPQLKPLLDRGVAVAINGTIYRGAFLTLIPDGSDVYIIPAIAGG
jgi:sulfur-carrier protein